MNSCNYLIRQREEFDVPGIDTVVEKLIKMKAYLEQLRSIRPESYSAYLKDNTTRYAVERLLQLIVDLALDINNILLSYNKKPPAPDYFNSFIELVECGVLEESFAAGIAPSTGLRNRLVHEYEAINNEVVYNCVEKVIEMYTLYIVEVNRFIQGK